MSELPFDDREFESRLIWILGSPRTGSTWLLKLLIHPFAKARMGPAYKVPEGAAVRREDAVVPIDEPYLPVHLTPLITPPYRPGEQPDPSAFLQNSVRKDANYFFCDEYADVWRPEVRRLALARFFAQADRGARRDSLRDPLVAIKEPNGSHGAELLMSLFPRSRLIFLYRDGRDVVESMVDALQPDGWLSRRRDFDGLDTPKKQTRAVVHNSRLWVQRMEATSAAYEAHPPELRIKVRYEDLLADPYPGLEDITRWLGLERSEAELRAAIAATESGKRAATPGLWRKTMSAREAGIMDEIMGPKLVELGYERAPGPATEALPRA